MMISQIKDEVVKHYQSSVNKIVKEDPKTQEMVESVSQIVKDTLPKVIHDAMVLWTAANLDKAKRPDKWAGQNKLGKIWMDLRTEFTKAE